MKIRKIIIFILFFFIVTIIMIFPSRIGNILMYYKNGNTLVLNKYSISFPISHWAYFMESKNGFELSGIRINTVDLEATVHVLDKNIKPALEKLCDNVLDEKKQFKSVAFKMYTCIMKEDKNTYFQTLDNNLIIETHTYEEDNKQSVLEFKLLLDNVKIK